MKTLNIKSKSILIAALVVAVAASIAFRVRAQDQTPPPVHDRQALGERISFGMIGITHGQTVRAFVSDLNDPILEDGAIGHGGLPPGPSRIVLTFLNSNGQPFLNQDGIPIKREATLGRGQATFLDLNFDELPPGPTRINLRAVVTVQAPPGGAGCPCQLPSVEVIDNATGRTSFVLSAPGVVRGFNPQPDPPR